MSAGKKEKLARLLEKNIDGYNRRAEEWLRAQKTRVFDLVRLFKQARDANSTNNAYSMNVLDYNLTQEFQGSQMIDVSIVHDCNYNPKSPAAEENIEEIAEEFLNSCVYEKSNYLGDVDNQNTGEKEALVPADGPNAEAPNAVGFDLDVVDQTEADDFALNPNHRPAKQSGEHQPAESSAKDDEEPCQEQKAVQNSSGDHQNQKGEEERHDRPGEERKPPAEESNNLDQEAAAIKIQRFYRKKNKNRTEKTTAGHKEIVKHKFNSKSANFSNQKNRLAIQFSNYSKSLNENTFSIAIADSYQKLNDPRPSDNTFLLKATAANCSNLENEVFKELKNISCVAKPVEEIKEEKEEMTLPAEQKAEESETNNSSSFYDLKKINQGKITIRITRVEPASGADAKLCLFLDGKITDECVLRVGQEIVG